MANDKDFVVNGPVVVGKDTKVTVGSITSDVQQTSYDIANATYDNKSFNFSSQDSTPVDVAFKTDGTKLYVMGNSTDTIYQYTLSTAWNVGTASYDSKSLSVNTQETDAYSVVFNNDGTKVYTVGRDNDAVQEYNLSTAWDISTGSHNQSFSIAQATDPRKVRFKSDGTKMYVFDASTDNVFQYSLSTAFDISTSSYESKSFNFNTQDASPLGIGFNAEGTKMFSVGSTNDSVYQYSLSTSWDVSTASYDSVAFSVTTQDSTPYSFVFDTNGSNMFFVGVTSDTVYQYSTASYADQIDLSTGNYFVDSPSGDYTYSFANAGDVQSFQIEATGGSEAVAETFSTTLYEGNSAEQTITNGIDLAADGGMVWGKIRSSADNHWIVDSENGIGSNGTYNYLQTNLTNGLSNFGDRSVKTFNSDGFTLANSTNDQFNLSPETYVSWTFKKQTKFFDVVTYTGAGGLTQTVSHSLGSTPGTIIVKRTDGVGNWAVYHRSTGATKYLELEDTAASVTNSTFWYDTEPTSTQFTVGNDSSVNNSGYSYVAYLFAHDTASDGLIQCGSYTGNGSTTGPVINLGWQPQWLLFKRSSGVEDWIMFDNIRGMVVGGIDPDLRPNRSQAEGAFLNYLEPNATGFKLTDANSRTNNNGDTYIYMAIRSASAPAITWPTNIEWTGGSTPSTPAEGETDVYTFTTDDGGTTYTGIQSIDNAS